MKKFVFLASFLGALVTISPASAQLILDFGPGVTASGTCSVLTSTAATCTTPVGILKVGGAGSSNGSYVIDSGTLSFSVSTTSPGTDTLTLSGSVDCTSLAGGSSATLCPGTDDAMGTQLLAATTLATGGSGLAVSISLGAPDVVTIGGSDSKTSALLTALGISAPPGWSISPATNFDYTTGQGLYSYDYSDTAVPEPGSVLLLGTVLFGVTGLIRRRAKKA